VKVALLVDQYIRAMRQPGARGISAGQEYALRIWERSPIAEKEAADITLHDLMQYGRARKANQIPTRLYRKTPLTGLSPATVGKDFSDLSVILTWAADELDHPLEAVLAIVKKAKRKLKKERIVAKAKKRTRRPAAEELALLLDYFRKQNDHPRTAVDMVPVVEFSYEGGRRIGETCSIRRKHVNLVTQTYICYQSKQRVWHEFILFGRALEIVKERLAVIPDDPEARLFPFSPKTCSARYTLAKKKLGIKDLRLHDNRRECFSRCFAMGMSVIQVRDGVSGHLGDAKTLMDTYTHLTPNDIHAAVRKLQERRELRTD